MEIFKMEDKKKEVKDNNELIKKQIKNIEEKSSGIEKIERQ